MSQYNRYFAQSLSYYGCIFPKSFDKGNTFADAVRHFHHHGQPDTLKHHRITAACAPTIPVIEISPTASNSFDTPSPGCSAPRPKVA